MSVAPQIEVFADAAELGDAAARLVGNALRQAVADRGRASFAISGGGTPQPFFRALARAPLPWERIDVFQVDERIAPDGHADRNATAQRQAFAAPLERSAERFHWMPVTAADLAAAAAEYAATLRAVAGEPPVLDVVHLGIGADGHTASLFPGERLDAPLEVTVTGEHQGRRRMTFTLPLINRARLAVFLVSGESKRAALAALLEGAADSVAAHVRARRTVVLADRTAAPAA